ncbi:MAG: beta-propeller repeat-containing protein, partial [Chthonomonadales bacterium]|nr:beta-propeller repeat-containing protein [Chthonomonadales bacterium]
MNRKSSLFSLLVGGFGLTVLCNISIGAGPARADGPSPFSYRLVTKIPVGGEGGWDYLAVDSGAHRLYVTRSTHVMVIDTEKNALVGDIPNTPGVHGVAIAAALG